MNRKGNKKNLEPAHPGNTSAQQSGLYSERRRAEMTQEIQKDIAKDLRAFLTEDRLTGYAQKVALRELHAHDIAVHGISDRRGKPRRAVATYNRLLRETMELNDQFQAELAAIDAEELHAEPVSEEELLRLLREIAHDWGKSAAAAITAIKILFKIVREQAETPRESFVVHYALGVQGMEDEQFKTEYHAQMEALTTDREGGVRPKPLPAIIQEMASRDGMGSENELLDLFDALAARLRLPDSHGRVERLSERTPEAEAQLVARVAGIAAGLQRERGVSRNSETGPIGH